MKDFIFDYYGYNVPVIKDNSFIYNDYTFIIFAVNDTEESLIKLDNLLYSLRNSFNDDIVYIVKNKYNKYISQSTEDYNITLLCYKNKPLSNINDFIKINVINKLCIYYVIFLCVSLLVFMILYFNNIIRNLSLFIVSLLINCLTILNYYLFSKRIR